MIRARESGRADRLFNDRYAQVFLDAALGPFPAAGNGLANGPFPASADGIAFYARAAVRTRFFDDYLSAAVTAGCGQVVLLAAGLDARAFRLAWSPGTRVFEVDGPDVLSFKDTVLADRGAIARCERVTVPADLGQDWTARLGEAGFERCRRTAWLAEGVLLYLTAGEAGRLLSRVTALSAPGSQLAFEHSPAPAADRPAALREYAPVWKGGLGEGASAWLAGHGWQPEFRALAAVAGWYRREVPGPRHGGFLTATRG
jgi:methyltransferase (TIGR00027 family)